MPRPSDDRGQRDHGSGFFDIPDRSPALPHPVFVGHYTERSHLYHSDTTQVPMPGHVVFLHTVAGAGRFWDDGRPVHMRPGMGFLSLLKEPRTAWGFDPSLGDRWEFVGLVFAGEPALLMAKDMMARHGRVYRLGDGSAIVPRIRALAVANWHHRRLSAAAGMDLVCSLLTALVQAHDVPDPADGSLAQRAEAQLRAEVLSPPTVSELAARLKVGREHLTRVFTAAYGLAPGAYVRRLRLEEARRLLSEGRLEAGQVAAHLGWASVPAFHRAFTAFTGVTPGAWRRLRV
jgi:AraC-like DNA-binding protein